MTDDINVNAPAGGSSEAPPAAVETPGSQAPIETAAAIDNAPPATPPVGAGEPGATPENAASPEVPNWQTFDPATLPDENLKTVFTELKTNFEGVRPIAEWLDTRGGKDFVESDLALVDYAWAEDPTVRRQFHENFFQQSPQAYERFIGDILNDDNVKVQVLADLGLNPQLIDLYRQVSPDGMLNGQKVASQANIDPAVYDNIRPELQAVFKNLPAKVQEDWALSDPEILNWNLERAAIAEQQVQAAQLQQQRLEAERQAQAEQAAAQRQDKAYQDIKGIIRQSITKAFPEDTQAQDLVLAATETTLFDSPEGKALWLELAGLLQRGELKAAQQKIPGMVARAQVIATEKAKYLSGVFEKARKWDSANQPVNTRREPGISNGQVNLGAPNVEHAGEYRPENIMAYWNQAQGN